MGGERQPGRNCLTLGPRAFYCTVAGTVLDVATVIVCALNAVSAQQAIAMALPAGLITAGGVIALLVRDPWVAWRRGFEQGSAAAGRCDPGPMLVDVTPKNVGDIRSTV